MNLTIQPSHQTTVDKTFVAYVSATYEDAFFTKTTAVTEPITFTIAINSTITTVNNTNAVDVIVDEADIMTSEIIDIVEQSGLDQESSNTAPIIHDFTDKIEFIIGKNDNEEVMVGTVIDDDGDEVDLTQITFSNANFSESVIFELNQTDMGIYVSLDNQTSGLLAY